ncbi:MAG TPA: response regulator [Pyrinomonadaceae bacterium]
MAQRKLLLADDSITIQKVINLTFADEGISVTSVGNGLTAVERLLEVAPDLVLADVHMPGLSGYEVCERIRQTPGFENIPVMLLVGSFEPFDEAEARRVGADDFLTKPFQSIKQLVSKVHSLLESPGRETTPETKTETAAIEQSAAAGVDFAFFDDKSSNEDLLQVNDGNFNFRDSVFDDEMIETSSVNSSFADTFEDLDISSPAVARNEKPENEWRVVEPENLNRFEDFSDSQHEAPTVELNINEISSPFEAPQERFETENAFELLHAEQPVAEGEIANDLLEMETEDDDDGRPELFTEEHDFDLNFHTDNVIDIEPEMNFVEQESRVEEHREEKPVSPFADLFDDDDLLGIEDEIRAEIGEQNFQPQPASEAQIGTDEAITPEIVAPETENQSQEIATVNNANQSTAVEKPGEYAMLNISPEVIDAIAARVVEKLSDKVIEKIAWEIVPDRFDLIVRKTMQNKDRER